MKRATRSLTTAVLSAGLAAMAALAAGQVATQGAPVLRVARGMPSSDIAVVENRAVVVDSAVPFVEVSVAQPSIADISPLSDRAIYVFGRSRGTTTLTVLGKGGRLITSAVVQVTPDIAGIEAAIERTRD